MYIGWKKFMIMIVFFSLWTWFFYVTLSEDFWKFSLKKIMYKSWKKTHAPTVKIMYNRWFVFNFSRIGAYLINKKIPHFPANYYAVFRRGFFIRVFFVHYTPPPMMSTVYGRLLSICKLTCFLFCVCVGQKAFK